ncbi:zinc metalloproteinase nas-15-like isoform X2 [Xenia sp. Carnegie-2017]|nr:zinc metalloproteinase nas-15-like isoform X2 [Xenia sp. Carnegie-2017]
MSKSSSSIEQLDFGPELIEGDIVLDKTMAFALANFKESTSVRRKRDVSDQTVNIWKDGVIAYVISDEMSGIGRRIIRKAFRKIAHRTCVRFIPKQNEHKDYVKFISKCKGCYSSVGRKGGEQVLCLGEGCLNRPRALHEIMHALGFFHEHSRLDRDNHVKILWWNIQDGMERNFLTYRHSPTDSLKEPYDFLSIMHYDNKAFSSNGMDTIQSKRNPKMRFGKVRKLSKVDLRQLKKLYRCPVRMIRYKGSCRNLYWKCNSYATRSDMCETSYVFMKFYCPRACAFC